MSIVQRLAGVGVALAIVVSTTGACTIYATASLSGLGADDPNLLGGCFQLSSTACGKCIATQCEAPNRGGQPSSLSALCTKAPTSVLIRHAQACAKDPDITSDYTNYCSTFFGSSNTGQYATALDSQGAIENNLKLCVRDLCLGDCRTCTFTMTDCGTEVPISKSPCGKCIADATALGGTCHDKVIATDVCNSTTATIIKACALPKGGCKTPSCTALFTPGTGASAGFKALSTCLAAECSAACN